MSVVASQSLTRKQAEALLCGHRWFSGGDRQIRSAHWHDVMLLPDETHRLCVVQVQFESGERQAHVVVVDASLRDCAAMPEAQAALFQYLVAQQTQHGSHGMFEPTWKGDASGAGVDSSTLRALSGEQSNTSFVVDERYVFKLIRQVHTGPNPEVELLQYLAACEFSAVPVFCGAIGYRGQDGERLDLAVITQKIPDAQDGWQLAVSEPDRLAASVVTLATTLAELHNTLGGADSDGAFAPEDFSANERNRLTQSLERLALATKFSRTEDILRHLDQLPEQGSKCIRVHGDLHLGQTLVRGDAWYFLDFEGEPTRTLEERRAKASPLKDVAGMLRSFSYAEASSGRAGLATSLREPFISAYRESLDEALQPPAEHFMRLLAWYEIEKALYELDYETRYRPDWVHIPRSSLEKLCDHVLANEPDVPTTKVERLSKPAAGETRKGDE